jgi:hypothetical protein
MEKLNPQELWDKVKNIIFSGLDSKTLDLWISPFL